MTNGGIEGPTVTPEGLVSFTMHNGYWKAPMDLTPEAARIFGERLIKMAEVAKIILDARMAEVAAMKAAAEAAQKATAVSPEVAAAVRAAGNAVEQLSVPPEMGKPVPTPFDPPPQANGAAKTA